MYVIQDKETQNYLSTRSFWTMDGISWELYEYTGKLGTEFYSTFKNATEALNEQFNNASGLNRQLHIIEVDMNNLPFGEEVFIVNTISELQKALDTRDVDSINHLMSTIYPDYSSDRVRVLIAYNEECDIKAKDLIKFRKNYPNTPYMALFCFAEKDIKAFCR